MQTEILKAGEMHRKGQAYKAQKAMSTSGSLYMTACCDGRARLGVCVTLSQSPQHGFETWFTLQYAANLVKLRAPLVRQKAVALKKAIEEAGKAAKKAEDAFAKAPQKPSTKVQMIVYMLHLGELNDAKARLAILHDLSEARHATAKAGPAVKLSKWDIVRRKKTPEQRAHGLVRAAKAWNAKLDSSKIDPAQVAETLKAVGASLNDAIKYGKHSIELLGTEAKEAAVSAATKVGPAPTVELAAPFNDPSITGGGSLADH